MHCPFDALLKSIAHHGDLVRRRFGYVIESHSYKRRESVKGHVEALTRHICAQAPSGDPVEDGLRELISEGHLTRYGQLMEYVHHHPRIERTIGMFHKYGRQLPNNRREELSVLEGMFVPLNVLDWIMERAVHQYEFWLRVSDFPINASVWSSHPMDRPQTADLLNMIAMAIRVVTTCYSVPPPPTDERMALYIFLTPFGKRLDGGNRDDQFHRVLKSKFESMPEAPAVIAAGYNTSKISRTISIDNVNSALYYSGQRKYITIWRREELAKVLIHELMHHFQLEKVQIDNLVEAFRLNCSKTVFCSFSNEFVTEVQTWYLYLVYRQAVTPRNAPGLELVVRSEQEHCLKKISQILAYNGLTSLSQFWNNANPRYTINCNCSVVYYYILKGLFVQDIDETVLGLMLPRASPSDRNSIYRHISRMSRKYASAIKRGIRLWDGNGDARFTMMGT